MYTITLTAQQLNNLKVFLSRAQLVGKEVEPFVELIKLLPTPKPEDLSPTQEEDKKV